MKTPETRTILPFLTSLAVGLNACAPDAYEGPREVEATIATRNIDAGISGIDVSTDSKNSDSMAPLKDNLCEVGSKVYSAMYDRYECPTGTLKCPMPADGCASIKAGNEELREDSKAKINAFLNRLVSLLSNSKVKSEVPNVGPGNFDSKQLTVEDKEGGKHLVQVFTNEYETIVHFYLNFSSDKNMGYMGTETYHFTIGADSMNLDYVQNGDGDGMNWPVTFQLADGAKCGKLESTIFTKDTVTSTDVYGGEIDKAGNSQLSCKPGDVGAWTSCDNSVSSVDLTCNITSGEIHAQIIQETAIKPSETDEFAVAEFLKLQTILKPYGVDLVIPKK